MAGLAAISGCPQTQPGAATKFRATLNGASEVPPVTTNATGSFEATIADDGQSIAYTLTASNITNVTVAHIHVGAAGVNGPPIFFLFNATTDGAFTSPVTGTLQAADLTPGGGVDTFAEALAEIRAGNTYVNVHTQANPNGEIRGQVQEDTN
jgi:hypothetical protein